MTSGRQWTEVTVVLHVSETHPPSPELLRHAQVIDNALAEAGYPDAFVSVNEHMAAVIHDHLDFRTGRYTAGPPIDVIDRAYEVAAPVNPWGPE